MSEEVPGEEYADLFRPEDLSDSQPDSQSDSQPEPPVGQMGENSAEPSETGRIFRSQGAAENTEAILAIPLSRSGRLKTLERHSVETKVIENRDREDTPHEAGPSPIVINPREVVIEESRPKKSRQSRQARTPDEGRQSALGTLSAPWIYGITIGVTFVFGLGSVLIFGGEPGILSGIGLVLVSVFVSFAVRSEDDIHAVFAPAIAFFIMTITAGQIDVSDTSIVNRIISVFFILGSNWLWIIGSTIVALTIVALRRRAASSA